MKFLVLFVFFIFIYGDLISQNRLNKGYYTFRSISVDEGLSHNRVNAICQDSDGFIWIATGEGLNQYDGSKIVQFKSKKKDTLSILDNDVRALFLDSEGILWVGTSVLQWYDSDNEVFRVFRDSENGSVINRPYQVIEDLQKNIWVLSLSSGLYKISSKTNKVVEYRHDADDSNTISPKEYRGVFCDSKGNIWIGTNEFGVDMFNPEKERFFHFRHNPSNSKSLQGNDIYTIYEDEFRNLWLGSFDSGLSLFHWEDSSFTHYNIDSRNDFSQRIRTIFEDADGNLFFGTRAGLYVFNRNENQFYHFAHTEHPFSELSHNSILTSYIDVTGGLWIGTFAGGVNYADMYKKPFVNFSHKTNNENFLNDKSIYAIYEDDAGNLWIGTEQHGLNYWDAKTRKFKYYAHSKNSNSVSYNDIKAIIPDKKGNLWIGTYKGGLDYFDVASQKFTHYKNHIGDKTSLLHNSVFCLLVDRDENLWVGTYAGLCLKHKNSDRFIHYSLKSSAKQYLRDSEVHSLIEDSKGVVWANGNKFNVTDSTFVPVLPDSLNDSYIFSIHEDSKGNYWFGGRKRIVYYQQSPNKFFEISTNNGFVSDYICAISEDKNANIWVSTLNGLVKYNNAVNKPYGLDFKVYKGSDGIQSKQFNYRAFYKNKHGRMYFGGINGLTAFFPEDIHDNPFLVRPVITSLKIFNHSVGVGQEIEGRVILQKSISSTKSITIDHNHTIFTIEFTGIHFSQPEKNKFAYILEGFEDEWNYTAENQRFATYTNIPQGNYVFKVKAANPDGLWNDTPAVLNIKVLPAFWRTIWFKLIGVALICLIIFSIIKFFIKLEKVKHDLIFEKIKAKKIHELDMFKMQFFTNISHEIKTPLSLIISPLEKIIKQDLSPQQLSVHLKLMHRNAIRLFNIVNQLLDYRKLEAGKLTLSLKKGDIIYFVKDVVESFSDMAEERKIKLFFNSVLEELYIVFDSDKIQKVVYNLLSNAFKYSPDNSIISVNISLISNDESAECNAEEIETNADKSSLNYISISVKDTGVGIPEEKINKIFERFYQNDNINSFSSSSGIGLSLVKQLVKLHSGRIFVNSEVGKGSEFVVHLPLMPESITDSVETTPEAKAEQLQPKTGDLPNENRPDSNLPIILVVEDNYDMIEFIKSNLVGFYRVIEANDGEKGLELTREYIPDLIISDVMMPKMDGLKFSRMVKSDFRTSHIPIIMLTALASSENQKEGILAGVEEYITKPFDSELLSIKISQILATRNMLREKYSKELMLQPSEVKVDSLDDKFLRKAVKVVEDNIHDPDFGIEEFSREIGVSRMQLYRKMDALTDMTVKEFVRNIRIKRAAQLIEKKQYHISEIAIMVGFKHTGYFRQCFKKMYGVNPTDYNADTQ